MSDDREWRVVHSPFTSYKNRRPWCVRNQGGRSVARCTRKDDAAQVVAEHNTHAGLVAALGDMLEWFGGMAEDALVNPQCREAVAKARAELAKVEAKP